MLRWGWMAASKRQMCKLACVGLTTHDELEGKVTQTRHMGLPYYADQARGGATGVNGMAVTWQSGRVWGRDDPCSSKGRFSGLDDPVMISISVGLRRLPGRSSLPGRSFMFGPFLACRVQPIGPRSSNIFQRHAKLFCQTWLTF